MGIFSENRPLSPLAFDPALLRQAREHYGLSLAAAGRRAGWVGAGAAATWQAYESGKIRKPSDRVLSRLAAALELKPEDLMRPRDLILPYKPPTPTEAEAIRLAERRRQEIIGDRRVRDTIAKYAQEFRDEGFLHGQETAYREIMNWMMLFHLGQKWPKEKPISLALVRLAIDQPRDFFGVNSPSHGRRWDSLAPPPKLTDPGEADPTEDDTREMPDPPQPVE